MTREPIGPPDPVRIRRVRFRNFKALRDFSVTVEHINLLVGPNNSGKSTIVGAFRALAVAVRTAAARRPSLLESPEGLRRGYEIPTDEIPISLENAATDYRDDVDATVRFDLTNGNSLLLSFPARAGCRLFAFQGGDGPAPADTRGFRSEFPVVVGVVPVLGPVEHQEELVEKATVDRNLLSHRASRNFRSYWHHYPSEFDSFREMLGTSWPGMDMQPPEPVLADGEKPVLAMYFLEERLTRELYWSGFGFQIWCQLLTHILRSRQSSVIVIDEPETYLHPDLQRRLFRLLRDAGPDVVLATHSSELVADAQPSEVVIVDSGSKSAKRVGDHVGLQSSLSLIGSAFTSALTSVSQTKRVLFVEGRDASLLWKFAGQLGYRALSLGVGVTVIPLGGHRPQVASDMAQGIRHAIGDDVRFAVVLDRDYRCDEETQELQDQLSTQLELIHVHRRKEIENYLLHPDVLDRAIVVALQRQASRSGRASRSPSPTREILDRTAEEIRPQVQSQVIESRIAYLLGKTGKDRTTLHQETLRDFESRWRDDGARLELVPGKQVFSVLNSACQALAGISLTPYGVIAAFRRGDVPSELVRLLDQLERFRKS